MGYPISEVQWIKKLSGILAAYDIFITQKRIFDLTELNKEYHVEREGTTGYNTSKK